MGVGKQADRKEEAIEDALSALAFKRLYRREGIPDDGVEVVLLPEHVHRTSFKRPKEPVLSVEEPLLPEYGEEHEDDPFFAELRSAIAEAPIPNN